MRKLSIFFIGASLSFAFTFCGNGVVTASANGETVYVGGMSAGFTLKAGGAHVIGMCEVITDSGMYSPALEAGIRTGDRIVKINGIQVETVTELNEIVNKSGGKKLSMEVFRDKEMLTMSVQPIKDKTTDRYKIGVLVRDCVSGIGTVTYIEKNGRFGSLGHSVTGEDKCELQISDGAVYECSIIGISKGVRGKAGELRGMFLSDKTFGTAEKLCDCGIFGCIDKDFSVDGLKSAIADSANVKPGRAYIYSTVNGVCPKRYEIEIVKVDKRSRDNKNYVIKIVDEDLISETGGIVQGMSGSPILQEDKLVGAVTHVFLNDPTRGYGIDIETMLKQ